MMIAPETFRDFHKEDSLELCKAVRRELMESILQYEYNEVPKDEYYVMPSPETIYHMNNLYLIEICKLIEEKLNEIEDEEEE